MSKADFSSAEAWLHNLHKEKLPAAARSLFDSQKRLFSLKSGKSIKFESPVVFPKIQPQRPDGLLSVFDDRPLLDGISLVSCCMNRNDNLKASLKSWLKLPVDEIVIVDWSSSVPVAETLADIADSRVKIIRVENETRWILTCAFNVGLRFASYQKVYKLDADIETEEDFIDLNYFDEGEYIRGSWESALAEDQLDQVYINGSYGCYKSDLSRIGYYNEHIRTYGWDDSDLYTRLSAKCGLKQKNLVFSSLKHIFQEQEERLKHQDITKSIFLNRFSATEFTNSCNKFTVALFDQWWPSFLQDYELNYSGNNIWSCCRTTEHRLIPESVLIDARRYAVLENLFEANPEWSERAYAAPWMAGFIFEQYTAEIPFNETAAMLLFEESEVSYFGTGTSPYEILKDIIRSSADQPLAYAQRLSVFEGSNKRFEITCAGQRVVIQAIEPSLFQSVKDLHGEAGRQQRFVSTDLEVPALKASTDFNSERILAISLYDETNQERVAEYLESMKRNLQFFDSVAIFYEESNGEMYARINDMVAACKPECKAHVIWIHIKDRPTFKEIFQTVDFIFPRSIVITANADIVFDETIYKLTADGVRDSFLVLSRKEMPECTGGNGGLIMNHFGLPNTWSADAWIYMTPRKVEFRADFPIGTFHCDSFLNYYIGQSPYKLYNPCLSINAFHLHHEDFNSSEFKRLEHAAEIEEKLRAETELCGGEAPIRGVQWCRIEDVSIADRADQIITWSNFIINIFVDAEGKNLVSSLAMAVMCLKLSGHIEGNISVSLNIPAESINSEIGNMLFFALQVINSRDLSVAVTNPGLERPFVNGPDTCDKVSSDIQTLVRTYLASFSASRDISLFETDLVFNDIDGIRRIEKPLHMSIYFADGMCNDLTTYYLLKNLRPEEINLMDLVLSALSQEYAGLKPFADELQIAVKQGKAFAAGDLNKELWSTALPKKPISFEMSYLTSIYRGTDFFRGFLENIAAAAIECNAEVILVDAASPDNEKEIFNQFVEEFPGLARRFKYISLDEDPGLYNCWKLAIEKSSSRLVGNANLDDRRSPYQTTALIEAIRNQPETSGAATALRATKARNAGWYSITGYEYWFTEESSSRIAFDSLYLSNENGDVYSKNLMHCMPVWKKSLHQKYGYFNEDRYGTSADWAFWLECTKNGEVFTLIPEALSMYFISESSHNRINDREGEKELAIIREYLNNEQQTFIQQ